MGLNVYLSGEIHTDWREQIIDGAQGLDVTFNSPVTDHDASDDCGVAILGAEANKYWHDHKGAMVNAIRDPQGDRRCRCGCCALWRQVQAMERGIRCRLCCGIGKVAGDLAR